MSSRHSVNARQRRKAQKGPVRQASTGRMVASCLETASKRRLEDLPSERKGWFDARSKHVEKRLRWALNANSFVSPILKCLNDCSWRHPCGSGMCARCIEIAGHEVFRLADKMFSQAICRGEGERQPGLYTFTIVLPGCEIPHGGLADFDHVNWTRRFKRLCDKVGMGPLVGVIEFSFTEFQGGDHPPHITPHAHGIAVIDNVSKLKRKLSSTLKKDGFTARPYRIEPWKHTKRWTSYTFKLDLVRRRVTREQERINGVTGEIRICQGTNTASLRSPELIELALCLHELALDGRVITRQCQFYARKGKLRLRLLKPD